MNSRMDKYYNSNKIGQRSKKNEELYKKVGKESLENFKVNSNATVLSDDGANIDLEMLKSMLDKKYHNSKKKKTIDIDLPPIEDEISLEQTKEYDINAILEKAKENKTIDYEKERLKKIRDTQYDILKNLDLSRKDEEEKEEVTPEEERLMTLINTITLNEENNKKDLDPLDLFQDLKGDENTKVIEGISNSKEEKEKKTDNTIPIDKSFYTKSFNLSKKDFDDFKELQEDMNSGKAAKVIIIILITLIILAGLFYLYLIYFK